MINNVKNHTSFKGLSPYALSAGFENNTLLNKATFDLTCSDVPYVIMANNKEERRERINRSILSFGLVFASPLIFLPFINPLVIKHAKLTPKLFDKGYKIIRLSNENLVNAEKAKEGVKNLEKELKIDFSDVVKRAGSYEKLRRKIINAKNTVLGCDIFLITGTFGNIGFFNDWQTKKKTGMIGYSAEMNMADKKTVEKRAKKYEKSIKTRFKIFMGVLAGVVLGVPLAVAHGLKSDKKNFFNNLIKKYGSKFDYTNMLFMKRLPLAIGLIGAHTGIVMASRNNTELKDNAIRSSIPLTIFFGGDILMTSLLGRLFDKFAGTNIMKKVENKGLLNKILQPAHSLTELAEKGDKRTKNIAMGLFWFNFAFLSLINGFGTPAFINRMIRKDVAKDKQENKNVKQ